MIEFTINGKDVGSEIALEATTDVEIVGKATFDPEQDALAFLELVQNGEVVGRFSRVRGESEIAFGVRRPVDESSWFAVRGYGVRLQEDPLLLWSVRGISAGPMQFASFAPTSNVHTAPIYVTLKGRPGIEKSPRSKRIARTWLSRLEDLERLLDEDNLPSLATTLEVPNFDAVPMETLRTSRPDLLREIGTAKEFFAERAK
jgi:hypothetical protein